MANDEQTCGKGLAEHAVVPRVMAELIATLAENLELQASLARDQEMLR